MRCDPGCAKVGIAFADIVVRRFVALFDVNAEFAAVTAGTLSRTLADNWRGSGRLAPANLGRQRSRLNFPRPYRLAFAMLRGPGADFTWEETWKKAIRSLA
jgi:hypothetical protein